MRCNSAISLPRRLGHRRASLLTVSLSLLTCALLAPAARGGIHFAPPALHSVGTGTTAAALAHFNDDGLRDLVVANGAASTVSVLLADGSGGFGSSLDLPVGTSPQALAVEDLNGDGFMDIVVTNSGSQSLSVLLGHGDGTFELPTGYPTQPGPGMVAVLEVTGDSFYDLIVANPGSSSFSVFPGAADGLFLPRADFALPGAPSAFEFGEFNDVEGLDMVFACAPDLAVIVAGNGTGQFSVASTLTVGSDPRAVAARDLDSDGRLDIVTVNRGSNSVSVLIATGPGEFADATHFAAGALPTSLWVEDIDQDGVYDLACAFSGDDAIALSRGRGDGTFRAWQNIAVSEAPTSVIGTDLDEDGYLDLIGVSEQGGSVTVFLQRPLFDGTVTFVVPPSTTNVGEPISPAVQVLVTDALGQPVADEPVWIWMDGNGELLGSDEEVATDPSGMATFPSLVPTMAGPKVMYAWTQGMETDPGAPFDVPAGAPAVLRFETGPTDVVAGAVMQPAVIVRVTDALDSPIVGHAVTLTLEGAGVLTGGGPFFTDDNGYVRFDSLRVTATGLCRLVASCEPSLQTTSEAFLIALPPATLQFVPRSPREAGTSPLRVAVGDLNADGIPDLVCTNSQASSVSVMLGTGGGVFAPRTDYAAAIIPLGLTLADVDLDGHLDVVVANKGSASVSVLRGNGAGALAPRIDVEAGLWPQSVQVADFNSDLVPDLAVSNEGDRNVSVMLGLGGGTFGPRTNYATPSDPRGLGVGDVDGDGHTDVSVCCALGQIVVLTSDGLGGFSVSEPIATAPYASELVTGDFDGDGRLDVAAGSYNGLLSVHRGGVAGGWTARRDYALGYGGNSLTAGDVDGDGHADIASTNPLTHAVSVLLGTGGGSFWPAQSFPAATNVASVAVADLNGDGLGDLVTADNSTHTLSLYFQMQLAGASLTFLTEPSTVAITAAITPAVRVQLMNASNLPLAGITVSLALSGSGLLTGGGAVVTGADGIATYADLRVSAAGEHRLIATVGSLTPVQSAAFEVLPAPPAGPHFTVQPSAVLVNMIIRPAIEVKVTYESGLPVHGVAVALRLLGTGAQSDTFSVYSNSSGIARFANLRLDTPGSQQLVATCAGFPPETSSVFVVAAGPPAPVFGAPITLDIPSPMAIASGDLNRDGLPDVVTTAYSEGVTTVRLGRGNGTFDTGQSMTAGSYPSRILLSDLNSDGILDMVVKPLSSTVTSLLGRGDGTFGSYLSVATDAHSRRGAAIGDLNRDGHPDLVVTNDQSNTFSVLLGNGNGSFQPQQTTTTTLGAYDAAIADLNQDGNPDLLLAGAESDAVTVYLGLGNGALGAGVSFATAMTPAALAVADLNRDGKLDVAVACTGRNGVSVLLGDGLGGFAPKTDFDAGIGPVAIVAADADDDGNQDLLVGSIGTAGVSLLLGNGAGQFLLQWHYPSGGTPWALAVADVNGDTRLDVLASNRSPNTLGVLLGTTTLPTPTLVELLRATSGTDGIRVEWRLADPTALRTCVLERAATEAGEWLAVNAAPVTEGALQVVVDADAPAGATSWYRLSGTLRSGAAFTYGPVSAEGLALVRTLELATPWPNPSRGRATLSFGLPARANVRLSLVDLQGREVALLADGVRDAGRHVALLDAADLSASIYFVRLQSGGASLVRRFVIIR